MRSFYRDDSLFFCSPIDRIMTGDVYTLQDLTQTSSWINKDNRQLNSVDDFDDYTWTLFLGAANDGYYITPLISSANEFEKLTVRIMYYEKSVAAVYYIDAVFTDAPYEYEALCAVDLSDGNYTGADYEYAMQVGETLQLDCPRRFSALSEQYRWEVIEGDNLISLSGEISASCTITAKGAGAARVQVTYDHSYYQDDVLTGNQGYGFAAPTYEFYIEIT